MYKIGESDEKYIRKIALPLVMMALVWGGTLNSSAANLRTAVNGAPSGTLNLEAHQTTILNENKLKT